jgi:hypothetical protein
VKIIKHGDKTKTPWVGQWRCLKCECEIELESQDGPDYSGGSGERVWLVRACPTCAQTGNGWKRIG